MDLNEAKDVIIKAELCYEECLRDLCNNETCEGCAFYVKPEGWAEALDMVREYYIKKHKEET